MSIDKTITISKHEVVLDRMFAEGTWELAFGDNAFENDYTDEDVLHTLKSFSKKALAWDAMYEDHQPSVAEEEDTEENYEMREKMEFYLGGCTHS
tara:strand:+ start:853 stop:1137 length:285 start_codon:yes stop_codon:yes gene_type:complete